MTQKTIPAGTSFGERLHERMVAVDSLVCVGLDPSINLLPDDMDRSAKGVSEFCRRLVDATADYAAAFKPNLGFFIGLGRVGLDILWEVRQAVPVGIPVILDCKIGDIGSTAEAYAMGWFDEFAFDAITVNPYMGEDSAAPLLTRPGTGVFILCKTSNPGSADIQDLPVGEQQEPLYLTLASRLAEWDARHAATIGLVVGATWPEQLAAVRARCPVQPILLPGLGAQGGNVKESVMAGTTFDGTGLLCSASRSIMYASSGPDFALAARNATRSLRDEINGFRPRQNM